MKRKQTLFTMLFILIVFSLLSGCFSREEDDPDTIIRSLVYDSIKRTYRVHIPNNYNSMNNNALVFVLHGGGGSGENMENRLTQKGFNGLSKKYNFIVVYPDGIDNKWNDGRSNISENQSFYDIDDLGFLSTLIDNLSEEFHIRNNNVFFTGISNGGFMCYRLAFEIPYKIKAIAPVAATNAVEYLNNYAPNGPISLCIICGTTDPMVPYEGGYITIFNQTRSEITSVNDTVDFWVDINQCNQSEEIIELPDLDPNDGTIVTLSIFDQGINNTTVNLYSIKGGGHTWPGGLQYFPEWLIGKTSRDIDANQVIWDYFSKIL